MEIGCQAVGKRKKFGTAMTEDKPSSENLAGK